MKFTIEIYAKAGDGSERLLRRTAVSTITPLGARKDARHLLADWKRRGAKSAHVLNVRAETNYEVGE